MSVVIADQRVRQIRGRNPLPAPGEVPGRGAGIAHLLGQPAQARCDLRPVLRGGPALGLAVGALGSGEVPVAHPHRGDLAPCPVRDTRFGQREDLLPRRPGLVLVVEAVQAHPQPEERGRGLLHVRGADHPLVVASGVRKLAGGQQLVGTAEQRCRGVVIEWTRPGGVHDRVPGRRALRPGLRQGRGVVHRRDSTRLPAVAQQTSSNGPGLSACAGDSCRSAP